MTIKRLEQITENYKWSDDTEKEIHDYYDLYIQRPNKYISREFYFDTTGHNDGVFKVVLRTADRYRAFIKNVFTGQYKEI